MRVKTESILDYGSGSLGTDLVFCFQGDLGALESHYGSTLTHRIRTSNLSFHVAWQRAARDHCQR